MAVVTSDGVKQLDPFDATKIFDVLGRAHALADADVLEAFDRADNADMAAWRSWNYLRMIRGSDQPDNDITQRTARMFEEKEEANIADAALKAAVRVSLHRGPSQPIQRPQLSESSAESSQAGELSGRK